MSSMRFFIRTDDPTSLKTYIEATVGYRIELEKCSEFTELSLSELVVAGKGKWFEWYTFTDRASFDHCAALAVIEAAESLITGFLELHSACADIELAGPPGRGLAFDRQAFLEHLVSYRDAVGWYDDEGNKRMPYPQEVVNSGQEQTCYLSRFLVLEQ